VGIQLNVGDQQGTATLQDNAAGRRLTATRCRDLDRRRRQRPEFAFRQAPGDEPTERLNARLKASSAS
jgi:hypothetical protein